jgi:hypothetical protein
MLKITIVTDGPYGDRTYQTIKNEFETNFIELTPPTSTFIDELELPDDAVKVIEGSDILITYTLHPDLTLELVERFASKVDWIIVAAWNGEGFKNQLETSDNVICPYIMCELEERGDATYDEFASRIGSPEVEVYLDDNGIQDVKVKRCSPCGSTQFVSDFIKNKYKNKKPDLQDLPREAGLILQHYPCRASKIRLFTSEECKKDQASEIHRNAFKKALE